MAKLKTEGMEDTAVTRPKADADIATVDWQPLVLNPSGVTLAKNKGYMFVTTTGGAINFPSTLTEGDAFIFFFFPAVPGTTLVVSSPTFDIATMDPFGGVGAGPITLVNSGIYYVRGVDGTPAGAGKMWGIEHWAAGVDGVSASFPVVITAEGGKLAWRNLGANTILGRPGAAAASADIFLGAHAVLARAGSGDIASLPYAENAVLVRVGLGDVQGVALGIGQFLGGKAAGPGAVTVNPYSALTRNGGDPGFTSMANYSVLSRPGTGNLDNVALLTNSLLARKSGDIFGFQFIANSVVVRPGSGDIVSKVLTNNSVLVRSGSNDIDKLAIADNSLLARGTSDLASTLISPGEVLGRNDSDDLASVSRGFDRVIDAPFQTTTASPQTIATYSTLADERAISVRATVIAREAATDDSAKYVIEALFNRDGSSVVTSLDATFLYTYEDQAAWDVSFSISSQHILVRVTGEAGKTIKWRCFLEVSETGG